MAVFKCKMCGGDLEVTPGITVAECEYCGTQQTLPKVNEEVVQNLFNRANALRLKCEFDKAEQIYEKILQENNAESEAHWGIVLCKYGIEYVEDPKTYKRIPTCHRTSYDAVTADADYLAAIEHADSVQRSIYEAEAKAIDEIQKNILSIVKDEKPFDVFICYKETDESGKRTVDSTIANDIYYQLTQEGLKVFYAAITLEDKLGREYEPYIFAALNSAKVMLVIGTKPQYFTAVWVKNEWSRFLKLMKSDRSKLLIPCYKDMDAYELPEEFAHLQAQDMGKIGFINDVVRGIKKVTVKEEPKATVIQETVVSGGNANITPLLKRAFMFLEDGDWNSANEYCEKVLDIDPENASAYLGKLLSELRVRKQEALKDHAEPFDNSNNYQKAVRFADEKLKSTLTGYIDHINTRNENTRLGGIYSQAKRAMSVARAESAYKEAARIFESVSKYLDSASLAKECYEKAEAARKDEILSVAKAKVRNAAAIFTYNDAIKLLKSIPGWKDADEQMIACQKKIEELEAKAETERLEKERKAEIARRIAKRNKKIALIITPVICAIVAFIILLNTVIIPTGKYNDAIAMMEAGKYEEAKAAFEAMNGYKDSADMITECYYLEATALMSQGKYEEAIAAFDALDGYKDSASKITECNTAILDGKYGASYEEAIQLMNAGKYEEAISIFELLGDYKNSLDLIVNCLDSIYTAAVAMMNSGDYAGAYQAFLNAKISSYKDSVKNRVYCQKAIAIQYYEAKDYSTAIKWFEKVLDDDMPQEYLAAYYYLGKAESSKGRYRDAVSLFEKAENFSDAPQQMLENQYLYAKENIDTHDDQERKYIYDYLMNLKGAGYKDSAQLYNEFIRWKVIFKYLYINGAYIEENPIIPTQTEEVVILFELVGGIPGKEYLKPSPIVLKVNWPKYSSPIITEYEGENLIAIGFADYGPFSPRDIVFEFYNKADNSSLGTVSIPMA